MVFSFKGVVENSIFLNAHLNKFDKITKIEISFSERTISFDFPL